MQTSLLETVELLLESKGISQDDKNYKSAKAALTSYMESFDNGVNTLLEGDYSEKPPTILSQEAFMKLTAASQSAGVKNTSGKGSKTARLDKPATETSRVKDDKSNVGAGKNWSDKPSTAPASKESVDKKAAAAQSAGLKNTSGKGNKQLDLNNKGMLESSMRECVLHDEYIEFVKSFNDGTEAMSTFVESVVDAFMESHNTVSKFADVSAMMEGSEAVADLADKVGNALRDAAGKIAEGEATVDEAKEEAKVVVDEVTAAVSDPIDDEINN